ncbi:MAG: CIA30 family protein [Ignavibacteriaceae bacterium]|nr:CIA30 family protein [Ignavibacteriaceae bacterium]
MKSKIADFTDKNVRSQWGVTNDDVMGGVSSSKISTGENDVLVFSGNVSLDNNGGFASLRSPIDDYNLSAYDRILIKVKGDGKTFSLSFRQTKYFTGFNFTQRFQTEKDKWQTIKLPFNNFKLKYYGREVTNSELPDKSSIKQLSILISDKQQGPFKIEIEWIGLY